MVESKLLTLTLGKSGFLILYSITSKVAVKKRKTFFTLVYTKRVNNAFGARWLASSEVIIQLSNSWCIARVQTSQKPIGYCTGKVILHASYDEWKNKTNFDLCIKSHISLWNHRLLTLVLFQQQTASVKRTLLRKKLVNHEPVLRCNFTFPASNSVKLTSLDSRRICCICVSLTVRQLESLVRIVLYYLITPWMHYVKDHFFANQNGILFLLDYYR